MMEFIGENASALVGAGISAAVAGVVAYAYGKAILERAVKDIENLQREKVEMETRLVEIEKMTESQKVVNAGLSRLLDGLNGWMESMDRKIQDIFNILAGGGRKA